MEKGNRNAAACPVNAVQFAIRVFSSALLAFSSSIHPIGSNDEEFPEFSGNSLDRI
jgi:hypothetical protein